MKTISQKKILKKRVRESSTDLVSMTFPPQGGGGGWFAFAETSTPPLSSPEGTLFTLYVREESLVFFLKSLVGSLR